MSIARGIRNNNPLNIRRSADKWQGLKAQQEDREFFQFSEMKWGWRAAFRLLCHTPPLVFRPADVDFVDIRRDSAIQASLMALASPDVQWVIIP